MTYADRIEALITKLEFGRGPGDDETSSLDSVRSFDTELKIALREILGVIEDALGDVAGGGGGGSVPGVARVLGPFPIAYNTPGLTDGVTLYTPEIGDTIIGGAILIRTSWDGTSPIGDFVFGDSVGIMDDAGIGATNMNEGTPDYDGLLASKAGLSEYGGVYAVTSAGSIKVVVSQDGQSGGDSPGATQGEADVYLIVAIPSLT